jgi:outer membrane receptor for ferrienterochelin and colicins
LRGIVRDASGLSVARATVSLAASDTALARVVEAPDGRFVFDGLVPGRYQVTAFAAGFAAREVSVSVPSDAPVTIVLEPAPVVENVRVTSASRQEELRSTLNTRVDVVSRARIEDTGAHTVGEVLREIPGVLTRRGSEGAGAAGQQIQGIDSKQVLVLLDGFPLVGARGVKRGGAINLDRQSTGALDRVEVVKGAASALYGSDAIGGVINLITADSRAPLHLGTMASGGSRGDLNAAAEIGARHAQWSSLFTIERHQSDGFDLTPTTLDTTGAPFRRTDLFGKTRWQPSSTLGLTASGAGYRNRTTGRSIGELGIQEDDVREYTVNVAVASDWLITPVTSMQVRGGLALFDELAGARLATPAATLLERGELTERLTRAEATLSHVVGARHQLQGGVEYVNDHYSGVNRLRNDSGEHADTVVGWAQHRFAMSRRVTTTAGLRVDRHSQFGTALSPKLGVTAMVTDHLAARASYGRGFRAPDIGQLYYQFLNPTNLYQVIGNPNLLSERAGSWQLGVDVQRRDRRARIGVSGFRNDVSDLIESVSLGFVATPAQLQQILEREGLDTSFRPALGRLLFTYKNINDAVTQGIEVDGEAALTRQISIAAAYTYLDARDDRADRALTGRHRHHGHARVTWALPELGFRANLRVTALSSWIAARSTGATVVDTIAPGFALLDAHLSQRVIEHLNAFVALDNLTNSKDPNLGVMNGSAPAPIYRPDAGRSVRFGVRWSWARQ